MSHVTFDIILADAMHDLKKLLDDDDPKTSASKGLREFTMLYVRYLQIYKKLEDCYDQIVHAQKHIDLRKALETCIGRMLEIRHWMFSLNEGSEFLDFFPILKDLKIGADVLEIPRPRFMIDDNIATVEARQKILEVKPNMDPMPIVEEPNMSKELAIAIIQASERGRQSRQRVAELFKIRKMQEEELHHKHSGGEALSEDAAARKIQALARGFLSRCRVKHSAEAELTLIGMNQFWHDPEREKIHQRLKQSMQRRKSIQALNRVNYDEAFLEAKGKTKELEGQEMREIIQEEINTWLLQHRSEQTGSYPPFPKVNEGGSKYIVNPPPKMDFVEEKSGKGKKDETKKKKVTVVQKVPIPEMIEEIKRCPEYFRIHVSKSVEAYTNTWYDKDDSTNLTQKHDHELLKKSIRPVIFEEVRVEVDKDTRVILNHIKKKMKSLQKEGGKDAKGASKKGDEFNAQIFVLDMAVKAMKKPPKDKTGQRTLESIFDELCDSGVIRLCPERSFRNFIGVDNMRNPTQAPNSPQLPSLAQVRQLMSEYCVLPLASDFIHRNAPYVKSILLYGAPGTGKTLLVHAACTATGATFINLSPRNLDGKFPGGQLKKMLQMAFKVAKIMAPTIIYIDEVEMLFVRNKKKVKALGFKDKPARLKKPLIKEISLLQPGDRILVLGTSSRPQESPSKGPGLLTMFTKRIYVPLPDYSSRLLLWRELLEKHGGVLDVNFNLSILARLSLDYTPSSMESVCKTVLSKKRLRKLRIHPLVVQELVDRIHEFLPLDKPTHEILKNWGKPPPKVEEPVGKNGKTPPKK